MSREVIIIALVLVLIYLYYQQKKKKNTPTEAMYQQKISDLEDQLISLAQQRISDNQREIDDYNELLAEKEQLREQLNAEFSSNAELLNKETKLRVNCEKEAEKLSGVVRKRERDIDSLQSSLREKARKIASQESEIRVLKMKAVDYVVIQRDKKRLLEENAELKLKSKK